MNLSRLINKTVLSLIAFCFITTAQAGIPVWSFSPTTSPVVTVSATQTTTVTYTVTNNSKKPHQLVLSSQTPTGIRQTGPCSVGPKGAANSACTLTLSINGAALPANNVSGGPILCQANQDGTPNLNQCYQPSPGDILVITRTTVPEETTLSTSILSILALSVNDPALNAALTGNLRQITITNTGINEARGLTVTYPTWPGGIPATTASSTCGSTLAAGDTCVITVTPGSNSTAGCNTGIAPTPGTITVSATNVATPATTDVVVLSYGCLYQGGYVYAVDDTTPISGSIGGKVVGTSDQASRFPNGVIWSSNGIDSLPANVSYDIIPGIDQTSTTGISSPTYANAQTYFNTTYSNEGTFPFPPSSSFAACNGRTDGACNSANILALYNLYKTNYGVGASPYTLASGPTTLADYAVGRCSGTISGFTGWYLPAICEMGPASNGSGCAAGTQNIVSDFPAIIGDPNNSPDTSCPLGINCLSGYYWSSTEYLGLPDQVAWDQYFDSSAGGSGHGVDGKEVEVGVRCARALTL